MSRGELEQGAASQSHSQDEDLLSWDKQRLVSMLRRAEEEKVSALVQRGRLIRQVNGQLMGHLVEIRELKAVNGRLREENGELRELCCFLGSERDKARELAGDWQRLGRRALHFLREDVGCCLRKLAGLESLQEALARDNLDLKELCLTLGGGGDGDGDDEGGGDGDDDDDVDGDGDDDGGGGDGDDTARVDHADLGPPCGARDMGDGSSINGSIGSPDQHHPSCCPGE